MIKRLRFLNLTTALMLTWSFAFAQVPNELQEVVLTGNLFGRSSADFSKTARNISTTVTEGSKGTVVETRRMKTPGAYGVKIRLSEVGKGKTNAKPGDEVWVYYSKKNPWITFRDTKDLEVQNPEDALTAKARTSGEGIPAPTTPVDDKSVDPNEAMTSDRYSTEAGTGGNCMLTNSCGGAANHGALKDVATKIADDEAKVKKTVDDLAKKKPVEKVEPKPEVAKSSAPYDKYKKRKYTMTQHEWEDFPDVMKYSQSSKVTKTIKAGMNGREPGSTGWCYRYVKRALVSGQKIKYPPGGHAREAVRDLKAQGFKNLMDSPYKGIIKSPDDAPKGSIIVYETADRKQSGDIQIKTDWGTNGGYVSDYYSTRSFLEGQKAEQFRLRGKPYRIIGVMIKP
ncbi:hypothetical protein [Bdellovibrio sp. HCB209]|uniref:hypothetical protein n=1 Tax=Bdellovibrio sp. HCB209 TaxID=3394354 RepID=UPI0039B4CD90